MNKDRLWIVTELFYPDQTSTAYILSKIANKLSEKYAVNIITTGDLYQKNDVPPSYSINKDINIIRVTSKSLDKNKLFQRLFRMVILTNLLFTELKKRIKENDKLLIVTNPALLLLRCAKLRRKKNIDYNILVHDVFPENTIPAGIITSKNNIGYKWLSRFFNKAYSTADKLIVLGRDMYDVVSKKIKDSSQTKIIIIENWGDTERIKPVNSLNSTIETRHSKGIVTIQYAGNIGRVQGLDSFISLLDSTNNPNLNFELYGEGAIKEKLQEFVTNNALEEQVHFYGSYSRDEQNKILNNCDIALVTLADGMYGLGVPSKSYNILAAGKPILFIGNSQSEIGRMITEESTGYVFEANEHNKILNFLHHLSIAELSKLENMGKRARSLAENKYSERIILEKFLHTI